MDCDYRRGFGLEIAFIDHFNRRLVTIFNYGAIVDLRTLQITTVHAKPFSLLGLHQSFPTNGF
jgi:hypothetical protein